LHFVEEHDGAGDGVEAATSGGFVREETLEETDVGGDDDGRGPVFGSEASAANAGFFGVVSRCARLGGGGDVGVVFEHVILAEVGGEEAAEHAGGLLDDASVGNDDDDAAQASWIVGREIAVVMRDVAQRENERGECLAAASGCSERE
jgi:hypothetical protein